MSLSDVFEASIETHEFGAGDQAKFHSTTGANVECSLSGE
jgi:hypothetical protein